MKKYLIAVGVAVILILVVVIFTKPQAGQDVEQSTGKAPVKIGYLPITDHLILGISQEKDNAGFEHVDLETVKFSDWATLSEAVRSGSVDGAIMLAPLAYQVKLKGADAKVVLFAHRDGSALIVNVKEDIETVDDLRGKTIAIPSRFSTHNMLLHLHTSNAGLVYGEDFTTVEMAPPDMVAALVSGSIDGYIVAEPFGARGELSGAGKVMVLSSEIWKHHPDCILVMNNDYLLENPEGAQELVTSLMKSGEFAENNRAEAAEIGHRFLGQPLDAMMKALHEPHDRVTFHDLVPNVEELNRLQDYMADHMGLFPVKVNIEELVDTSFAEEAYRQLGL
jgi:NitT/TauT family transport system substrate-binding protein